MHYGMTYHDFWFGDPSIVIAYREAEIHRQEAENRQAWLQGAYIYKALTTALTNAFAKKGTPPESYLTQPIDLSEPSRAEEIIAMGKSRAKKVRALESRARLAMDDK